MAAEAGPAPAGPPAQEVPGDHSPGPAQWGPAGRAVLTSPALRLTGRRLLDFVHPEDRAAVLASVRLALGGYAEGAEGFEGLEGSGRFPVRVRAADGPWRHVEAPLLPYQAPGGPAPTCSATRWRRRSWPARSRCRTGSS